MPNGEDGGNRQLWDVVVEVAGTCAWDRHDRERLAGELAVIDANVAADVLAAPTGCTVRLGVLGDDARSAAWAAIALTGPGGRRLGLRLETVLRHAVRSSWGRSFRRGLLGRPLRSADRDG